MQSEEIGQAYDTIGLSYQTASADNRKHLEEILGELLEVIPEGARILDIGCGTGKPISSFLASKGHLVTGVDVSQRMVELARAQVPEGEFFQADLRTFEPPLAGQYDAVIASHSLYYMTREEQKEIVQKFNKWLSPGGTFFLGAALRRKALDSGTVSFDEEGWADTAEVSFLGQRFKGTYGKLDAWRNLVQSGGFESIRVNERESSFEDNQDFQEFYILAKKV